MSNSSDRQRQPCNIHETKQRSWQWQPGRRASPIASAVGWERATGNRKALRPLRGIGQKCLRMHTKCLPTLIHFCSIGGEHRLKTEDGAAGHSEGNGDNDGPMSSGNTFLQTKRHPNASVGTEPGHLKRRTAGRSMASRLLLAVGLRHAQHLHPRMSRLCRSTRASPVTATRAWLVTLFFCLCSQPSVGVFDPPRQSTSPAQASRYSSPLSPAGPPRALGLLLHVLQQLLFFVDVVRLSPPASCWLLHLLPCLLQPMPFRGDIHEMLALLNAMTPRVQRM